MGKGGGGRGAEWWESPRKGTARAKTQSKGKQGMDGGAERRAWREGACGRGREAVASPCRTQ